MFNLLSLCRIGLLSKTLQKSFFSTESKGSIGFLGLGNMGSFMALNLAKSGFNVVVYDVSSQSVNRFLETADKSGVKKLMSVADSPKSVCLSKGVRRVITMLPSGPQIEQAYLCPNKGLLTERRDDFMFLDCTTAEPSTSHAVFERAKERGAVYVDSPVSGGVVGARDATLTFMLGGNKDHLSSAEAILLYMGKKVIHCGDRVGSGQAAKICNNMLLAISMIGTSEAMGLGQRLGLDPNILAMVLNTSSGQCWSSKVYNPVPGVVPDIPSSRDYESGFASALMLKDLGLALSSANEVSAVVPMGAAAQQIYRLMVENGLGAKDFSVVYKYFNSKKK